MTHRNLARVVFLPLAMIAASCSTKSNEASRRSVGSTVATALSASMTDAGKPSGLTLTDAAFFLPLPQGWHERPADRPGRLNAVSDDGDEVITALFETTPETFRKYAEIRRAAAGEHFGNTVEPLRQETIGGAAAWSFRATRPDSTKGDAGDAPNVFGFVVRPNGDGNRTAIAVTFFSAARSMDALETRAREILKNLVLR
jgi:hypothetical protein